jgi:hypothetical protein
MISPGVELKLGGSNRSVLLKPTTTLVLAPYEDVGNRTRGQRSAIFETFISDDQMKESKDDLTFMRL